MLTKFILNCLIAFITEITKITWTFACTSIIYLIKSAFKSLFPLHEQIRHVLISHLFFRICNLIYHTYKTDHLCCEYPYHHAIHCVFGNCSSYWMLFHKYDEQRASRLCEFFMQSLFMLSVVYFVTLKFFRGFHA